MNILLAEELICTFIYVSLTFNWHLLYIPCSNFLLTDFIYVSVTPSLHFLYTPINALLWLRVWSDPGAKIKGKPAEITDNWRSLIYIHMSKNFQCMSRRFKDSGPRVLWENLNVRKQCLISLTIEKKEFIEITVTEPFE